MICNTNPFGSNRRASLGVADGRVEARDASRRPQSDGVSFAVPHVLASASALALIGLVARYDAIRDYVRERRERRTEEGVAERAALLV